MKKRAKLLLDYERVGLKKEILPFEDGVRISGKKGEYEWWYFDVKLSNGGNLVIVFFAKPITSMKKGFEPYVSIDLTMPNGEGDIHREFHCKDDNFFFSKDGCDIRVGECSVKGDLNTYNLCYKDDEVDCKLVLKGNVPSWRPYAGQIVFGEKNYFAWLPSVPEGSARAEILVDGKASLYEGTGYHDHNWGDKLMYFLMHHWYWGRAKIADYSVITSYITADKKHNYDETPIFMIAKDGKIIADDALNCLTYKEEDYLFDEVTKKHFAKKIVYDYKEGENRYVITYDMQEIIERKTMKSLLTKIQYLATWLMGFRGSYTRVCGSATIEVYKGGELVEKQSSSAIWEQMYFGKDKLREVK